jgi:N12 class adenine-specific DNA methylase
MRFESLGVDLPIVDEAHEYKNVPLVTNYRT